MCNHSYIQYNYLQFFPNSSKYLMVDTGMLHPGAVDARLVNPTCARLHSWLWSLSCGHTATTAQQHDTSDQTDPFALIIDTSQEENCDSSEQLQYPDTLNLAHLPSAKRPLDVSFT